MAGEANQRQRVVKALRQLDAVSVENLVGPGTPDVEFIGGWIECKCEKHWPKRAETPLRLDHYTPQQRAWARRRIARGGRVFVCLQVGNEWFLFDGNICAECGFGRTWTRQECYTRALRAWPTGLKDKELMEAVRDTRLC